ncbi:hypothetical protein ACOSP7_015508 [Xanthoceras sorbifolium]
MLGSSKAHRQLNSHSSRRRGLGVCLPCNICRVDLRAFLFFFVDFVGEDFAFCYILFFFFFFFQYFHIEMRHNPGGALSGKTPLIPVNKFRFLFQSIEQPEKPKKLCMVLWFSFEGQYFPEFHLDSVLNFEEIPNKGCLDPSSHSFLSILINNQQC